MYFPRFSAANYKRLLPFIQAVDSTKEKAFTFHSEGFEPLSIDNLQHTFEGYPVYSIAHHYKQNGDLVPDPDMTFAVDFKAGKLAPLTFQDYRSYQEVYTGPGYWRPALLTDLDRFMNDWTKNIQRQKFSPAEADAKKGN